MKKIQEKSGYTWFPMNKSEKLAYAVMILTTTIGALGIFTYSTHTTLPSTDTTPAIERFQRDKMIPMDQAFWYQSSSFVFERCEEYVGLYGGSATEVLNHLCATDQQYLVYVPAGYQVKLEPIPSEANVNAN